MLNDRKRRERLWREVVTFALHAFGEGTFFSARELWTQLEKHGKAGRFAGRARWSGASCVASLGNLLSGGTFYSVDTHVLERSRSGAYRYPIRWRVVRATINDPHSVRNVS